MRGQNPILKNIFKWSSKWDQSHIIIVKYLHHGTYVYQYKITINIEIVLTLLGVKTIATKAKNNVDVIACVT